MSKSAEKSEWLRIAEEFEASGQTQREFAGRRGLVSVRRTTCRAA
jgi:hypothetical protein